MRTGPTSEMLGTVQVYSGQYVIARDPAHQTRQYDLCTFVQRDDLSWISAMLFPSPGLSNGQGGCIDLVTEYSMASPAGCNFVIALQADPESWAGELWLNRYAGLVMSLLVENYSSGRPTEDLYPRTVFSRISDDRD